MANTKKLNTKEVNLSAMPKKKQLGFMSCIIVVIGGCIGSGIFFKNNQVLGNTQSMILAIVAWVIASIGVIAMGLALTEIVSACKEKSNLGVAAWVKKFNSRFVYKSCIWFICYIFGPIILVALSYYFVQALFEGIGWYPPSYVSIFISLGVFTWFIFGSGLSTRIFNGTNWIIMFFKFWPLVFAIIIGYVYVALGNPVKTDIVPTWAPNGTTPLLNNMFPILGIIASIPPIFYAFNGFYYPANLVSEMKEPKKLPLTMVIGIAIVTFVYIAISVSIMIACPNGSLTGLKDWLKTNNLEWLYKLVYILIAIGILSVINGTAVTNIYIYEELIKSKQLLWCDKFARFSDKAKDRPLSGCMYCYACALAFFILITGIGLFYANTSAIDTNNWDTQTAGIFSFVDVTSNWDVLFIFIFIGFAIVGCLKNRKTKLIEVEQSKIFKPTAIIAIVLLVISVFYEFSATFINIGLATAYLLNKTPNFTPEGGSTIFDQSTANILLLSTIMNLIMLIIIMAILLIPPYISESKIKLQTVKKANRISK